MRRFSHSNAIKRAEGTLSTFPNSIEFSAHRRRLLMDIAALRMVRERLDYLAGMVEAFILDNGVVVVRQYLPTNSKIHWYKVWQGNIHLIDNSTELENVYADNFAMG